MMYVPDMPRMNRVSPWLQRVPFVEDSQGPQSPALCLSKGLSHTPSHHPTTSPTKSLGLSTFLMFQLNCHSPLRRSKDARTAIP